MFEQVFDRHLGPGVAAWPEASFLAAGAASTPALAARTPRGAQDAGRSPEVTRRYPYEPVAVALDEAGAPKDFRWRRRRYRVRAVLAHWVEACPWWVEIAKESGQRHCWRVEATSPGGEVGVYDLVVSGGAALRHWHVGRVLD